MLQLLWVTMPGATKAYQACGLCFQALSLLEGRSVPHLYLLGVPSRSFWWKLRFGTSWILNHRNNVSSFLFHLLGATGTYRQLPCQEIPCTPIYIDITQVSPSYIVKWIASAWILSFSSIAEFREEFCTRGSSWERFPPTRHRHCHKETTSIAAREFAWS